MEKDLTLAEIMSNNGYVTGLACKWMAGGGPGLRVHDLPRHADPEDLEILQKIQENYAAAVGTVKRVGGFDYVHSLYANNVNWIQLNKLNRHNREWLNEGAKELIENNHEDPFFLYYATTLPHGPNNKKSVKSDPRITPLGYVEGIEGGQPSRESVLKRTRACGAPQGGFEAGYHVGATGLDDGVGAIIEKLEALNLRENTLIVFISDHQPRAKLTAYEGARVPSSVSWPGKIEVSTEMDATASSLDIMPTILDACGIFEPEGVCLDGKSLLPLLTGQPVKNWRDSLLLKIAYTRVIVDEVGYKYMAWRLPQHLLKQQEQEKRFS